MENFLSKQANSIVDTFDTLLAYLREHVDAQGTQELDATYGNSSALEIMCNVAATTDIRNQNEIMRKAYGPLIRSCGKLLEQKPDASLDVYLMFSGLWWDAESYSLPDVIPIFEEGIARYPDSAQLHFNTGVTYLHEANNAYGAKRWDDVLQYSTLGKPHLEKARGLDPKLSPDVTKILRTIGRKCNTAQQFLDNHAAEKRLGEALKN
jgi:hypothetical protein